MGDPRECNIRVICRVRPQNETEDRYGGQVVVKFLSNHTLTHLGKTFTFDRVFKSSCTQEAFYEDATKPIVADVLAGYNGTIFAYGQTSSGKTHTMEGMIGDPLEQGVIPRIVQDIFNHIYQMDENLEFHIKVSYFEIYLDRIRDLLDVTKTNLAVHEDRNRVPYVKGATERFVSCPEEVMEAISEGKNNRHVSVTNMNEHSSRSHSVFLIHVKQENTLTHKKLSGKLYLVDLAGSEKVSKTGAEGTVLDEAKNINKSLSALGNVISCLAEGNKSYVPYRDSKLTRILQESLGGNSRTTIIICCSPSSYNQEETRTTLLFGQRAKTIKNTVVVNEELTADEWRSLYEKEKEKSHKLRNILASYEQELARWRSGDTVPISEQCSSTKCKVIEVVDHPRAPSASGSATLISDDERKKFEEERAKLFQQMDERDDEIQSQARTLSLLRQQVAELEETLTTSKAGSGGLQTQLSTANKDLEESRAEVREVLQALEELAVNYDLKLQEVDTRGREIEKLTEDLSLKQAAYEKVVRDLEELQETSAIAKRKLVDGTNSILADMGDLFSLLGLNIKDAKRLHLDGNSQLVEEFSMGRLLVTSIKSEVKSLLARAVELDKMSSEHQQRAEQFEKELSASQLVLTQNETRINNLNFTLKEMETKKRLLEEAVDSLNEEIAQLRANEQMTLAALSEKEQEHVGLLNSSNEVKATLEKQMEMHRDHHTRQLAQLRDEISSHQETIKELQESLSQQRITVELVMVENDKSNKEVAQLRQKVHELNTSLSKRELVRKDLQGLEEAVAKELDALYRLKHLFIKDLLPKVVKVGANKNFDEDDSTSSQAQQEKINFLENNLEQLTKVHKQLVRDNTELQCDVARLQKHLKATHERAKSMENAVKEAKEGAMKDRERYQRDLEKLKQATQQNIIARKVHQPNILKPIRAGQRLSTSGYQGDPPSFSSLCSPTSGAQSFPKSLNSSEMMPYPVIGFPTTQYTPTGSLYSSSTDLTAGSKPKPVVSPVPDVQDGARVVLRRSHASPADRPSRPLSAVFDQRLSSPITSPQHDMNRRQSQVYSSSLLLPSSFGSMDKINAVIAATASPSPSRTDLEGSASKRPPLPQAGTPNTNDRADAVRAMLLLKSRQTHQSPSTLDQGRPADVRFDGDQL